jgi:hypothetical protein
VGSIPASRTTFLFEINALEVAASKAFFLLRESLRDYF